MSMASKAKLPPQERIVRIQRSLRLLLRTRNELHFRNTRPTDLLSLEMQLESGYRLGYQNAIS